MKKKNTKKHKAILLAPTTNWKSSPKPDPWGCMAGTIIIQPNVDLTAPSGEVWAAEADQTTKQA
jgi:hypothetical protein